MHGGQDLPSKDLIKSTVAGGFFVQSCGIRIPLRTSAGPLILGPSLRLETLGFASVHVQGPDASRFGIQSRVEVPSVHLD